MEEDAAKRLSGFSYGAESATAYIRGKRLFARTLQGRIAAIAWIVASATRADRVAIGMPQRSEDGVASLLMSAIARLRRTPVIVYSEQWLMPEGYRHALRRFSYRRRLRLATLVAVPSELHRAFTIGQGVDPDAVRVIDSIYTPSSRSAGPRPPRRPASSQPATVLYVGRIVPLKGLDRLVRAVDTLVGRGAAVRLVVQEQRGGQYSGPDSAFRTRTVGTARSLLGSAFELREPTEDREAVYCDADVVVVPNRLMPGDKVPGESWGRVVEEAMLLGLPVISTDAVPSATKFITSAEDGLLIPWNDEERLVEALSYYCSVPNREV